MRPDGGYWATTHHSGGALFHATPEQQVTPTFGAKLESLGQVGVYPGEII